MTSRVTVVDYGVGNLFSVTRALEAIDAMPFVTSSADDVAKSDFLIFPGVGAFASGMGELKACGLDEAIKEFVAKGNPLLAICLGMQMLFEESEEFGKHKGLALLSGKVVRINKLSDQGLRIPHIGWSPLVPGASSWENTFLSGIERDESFYFVHSLCVLPEPEDFLGGVRFGDQLITAAVERGNICGVQFHPEKSGPAGLDLLSKFTKVK